ncbi:MAG: amino acid adenylation domain-containing protein [Sphingomonadales bacterium]|nr:amino acid adenylation domain-containing protein [Sphingomonadales bacterium]
MIPLHGFLAEAVAHHPDLIAIDVPPGPGRRERQVMSYAELDRISDRLARHLAPFVDGETIIALMIARTTPLLYAAQIAVLKAGGAYTCIDPAFPDARIAEILDDANAGAIIVDTEARARMGSVPDPRTPILDMTELAATDGGSPAMPRAVSMSDLAYVIYTSGTTGKPKGVQVEHRNIANLVASDIAEFDLGPGDRVVQGSSCAYDSSIEETWLAFASGATLVVMDDAAARLGPDIVGWLQEERVSVFCPPPTLLRSSGCTDPEQALPLLRLLYVGGEALPQDIADRWAAGRRMVNGYGPTECAVTCLRGDIRPGKPIGIGKPVAGMSAWVLDEDLNPVADGQQGELCMGGVGVARGYRHRPQLTAEKFVDHPQLGRIYRSGDLVDQDAHGEFFYHGRIDAQVKIRGYRVELGEIEARIEEHHGVRAAACRLQSVGSRSELVGFVVPSDPASPPDCEALRAALRAHVPAYMVPVQIGILETLPTSIGGKLDRARLPELAIVAQGQSQAIVPPATEMEALIVAAFADILRRDEGVSVDADFFLDLGGDSLSAALAVTLLRDEPRTQWVTVSDIYEARNARALARIAHALVGDDAPEPVELSLPSTGKVRIWLANLVQLAWLGGELCLAGWLGWLAAFRLFPALFDSLGMVGFFALMPLVSLVGIVLYVPAAVAFAVATKRLLIGRYRPIRAKVWSGWYLRHWIVVQACRLIPWPLLQGSMLQQGILRLLGARIGRGVHIHRGVDLTRGGWDLLDLGDDVALGQDAVIALAELDRGDVVIGPIVLETGATLQTRAGVSGWCRMGAASQLGALSVLNAGQTVPAGELWDGVPACKIGDAPDRPVVAANATSLPRWIWDLAASLSEAALGMAAALPAQALAIGACLATGTGFDEIWRWTLHPSFTTRAGILVLALTVVSLPITLVWTALLMRAMGPVKPGTYPRWSLAYLRAWLKAAILNLSGEWLTGTIFWPHWLRLAGMKIGKGCEISTIIDVVPELVEIGEGTFFADGIYLGGAHVQQGTVTLGAIKLGRNTFLGNHVVVPPGEILPDDILIGIATRADSREISNGQARFGHPSFDLPRREVVEVDRRLTHDPGPLRYWNRVFWEALRFTLPILPMVLTAVWYVVLVNADSAVTPLSYDLLVIPGATLLPLVSLCLGVLALKWLLIGRVKPGQHPLWSCWCSRWDFVYVAWARWATRILRRLDGTSFLPIYLRAMGLKIGRRAVLGPEFAQVVDPDMIEIGDGATVTAMFQAHTFEDRVLKVDKVRIGAGATVSHGTVPLYGAMIDKDTHVGAHSVIMKQEHLLPGLRYQGVPPRVLGRETASADGPTG